MNAREELEQLLEGKAKIKCALIEKCIWYDEEDPYREFELKVNYTEEEFKSFLESLDFQYNAGFGIQELHGIIWFEDGSWCTRIECDDSWCWEHHQLPEIPAKLL